MLMQGWSEAFDRAAHCLAGIRFGYSIARVGMQSVQSVTEFAVLLDAAGQQVRLTGQRCNSREEEVLFGPVVQLYEVAVAVDEKQEGGYVLSIGV